MHSSKSRFRFLLSLSAICVFVFLFSGKSFAADRYWVGTANGNSDVWEDTNNWSANPRGVGGASVPSASDVAILSFSGNTVRIRSAVSIGGILMSNTWTGSLLQGTGTLSIGTSDFRVGSGTFIGGSAPVAIADAFTQTGGSVRSVQSTFTLSGAFSITNGGGAGIPASSFSSTGTLVFDGTADQNFVKGPGTTLSLTNLTIDNAGGGTSDDVTMSGSLALSGALTITLGNLDLDTKNSTLNVENGITVANSAQATLVTDANITASGSISIGDAGGFTLSGSMTLTLNGDDQTLDTNNSTIISLTIASSSGTTLGNDESVVGTLQINTGSTLTLSAYTLYATGSSITNYATLAENTGKLVHTGSTLLIANSSYAEVSNVTAGNTVYFTLTDSDENINGTAADTVSVTLTNTNGDSETVTLTETSNTSGIFRGSITSTDIAGGSVTQGNSAIETANSVTITVTYTDAQDGLGNTDSATLDGSNTTTQTTTASTSSGGGGGGGGSRRAAVITSGGLQRRNTSGDVVGASVSDSTTAITKQETQISPWKDMKMTDKFAEDAMKLREEGIVRGNDDGTVRLNRSLSRAEAMALLIRTIGKEGERLETSLPFTDTDSDAWYAAPVSAALLLGIVHGYPDGTFRPATTLNLVQSLKIISIALGLASQDQELKAARWYDPYVTVARSKGLIKGKIDPGKNVSRGEFFSWLVLLLEN